RYSNMTTHMPPVTMEELKQVVSRLGHKKAPGLDHITGNMLKNLGPFALKMLLDIINSCLANKYFPTEWQLGDAIFILKGNGKDPAQMSSYRPITLLCIAGKILERIIKNRIELFAEPQKLLGANQFGFIRN